MPVLAVFYAGEGRGEQRSKIWNENNKQGHYFIQKFLAQLFKTNNVIS